MCIRDRPICIRLSHPIPGVLQPLRAIFPALQAEPGDFVVAPDPKKIPALRVGLAGMVASAVIIQLNDVGQMFAGPTAKRFAAFTPIVNPVAEPELQDSFLWLLRSFFDA